MSRDLVERWVRPEIRALAAYGVPDASGLIKLDAMENPYTWPRAMVEEWLEVLRAVPVNRYPDPAAKPLKRALVEAIGAPGGAEILLGNGSDELIQMIALALSRPGRTLLAPEPGFVMYRMIALFAGLEYVGVPLRGEDFALDMDAMRAAIERHRPAAIFLAYPNNPTGNLWDEAEIGELIALAPGLLVIDEAYAPFAQRSLLHLLGEFPNLLVMRTLSKLGLAGLRLGLLIGAPEWLGELDKVRLPYNINVLTQASAEFALAHRAVFDEQTRRVREAREALYGELRALPGIVAYPSDANFILFRVTPGEAGRVCAALREGGVLIKNLDPAGGALADCLRVTVGLPEENRVFLELLRGAL